MQKQPQILRLTTPRLKNAWALFAQDDSLIGGPAVLNSLNGGPAVEAPAVLRMTA